VIVVYVGILVLVVGVWWRLGRLMASLSEILDYLALELSKNDAHRAALERSVDGLLSGIRSDMDTVHRNALVLAAKALGDTTRKAPRQGPVE